MPVTALDLVKKLIAKAGVTHDGELTGDIPDEVATALDNNLLTIQAATSNHPQVKKVYFAQAYNGLDAEIENLLTEFEIDDTVKSELKAEQSSTKRAIALVRKIKELEGKKAAADPGKTSTLQSQINDLHAKLKVEQDKQKDLKTAYDKQLRDIHIQSKIAHLLSGYKTMYDELPADAKDAAMNALITKSLQDSDAEFTFDEKGALSIVKKDGTNLFGDNHTQLTPQSFIDKSLSKILKVSTPTPAVSGNNPPPVPGAQNQGNAALSAALASSLESYNKATAKAV